MAKKTRVTKRKKGNIERRRFVPLYLILGVLLLVSGIIYFHFRDNKVSVLDGLNDSNTEKIAMEQKINQMVKGYPIEQMVPYIIEKDKIVSAFLISIAKKESNWGKRSPKYLGKDCYNYWGYRGPNRVGSGGHSCFNNPKEAVDTVATRIEYLVHEGNLDTPEEMIVWKCGFSCKGHSSLGVAKWISDVSLYFDKLSTAIWKQ